MQKYSIIEALRKRDAEAVRSTINSAFEEFMLPDDDGVDVCEKYAGFASAEDMRDSLEVKKYRCDMSEWAQHFCLEVFDAFIKSGGEHTGCYEKDLYCRGCMYRNASAACFFYKMFPDEYEDICSELYEMQEG